MQQALSVSYEGDVAILNMNDGKVNALNPTMLGAIDAALAEAADAGALVLCGRPGTFSGGLDLKYLPAVGPAEREAALDQFTAVMMRVFRFPRPVLAAVSGHALGGGAILALAAELRYFAAGSSRFSLVEVPLGVPLPGFAMEFARMAVSGHALTELCLHGRVYLPDDALKAGLAAAVVPPEQLLAVTVARAAELAKLPRNAFSSTKARLREMAVTRGEAAIAREGMDFLAAFEALLEKARR